MSASDEQQIFDEQNNINDSIDQSQCEYDDQIRSESSNGKENGEKVTQTNDEYKKNLNDNENGQHDFENNSKHDIKKFEPEHHRKVNTIQFIYSLS